MRRVLIIAYYFPPLGGIGSLRAAKFASYLPTFGWEPTVIAPRNGAYYRDPTLSFDAARVIRTASFELSRWGKRLTSTRGGDTTPARVSGPLALVRDWARTWLYFPDGQVGWYPFALRAAKKAVACARFDAVFSTSFPITAHLVAQRLSQSTRLPWIAEFRDPWAERIDPRSPRLHRAHDLQRRMLASAVAVVAPSPTWADHFAANGARCVRVIPNGFDPCDLAPPERPHSLVITHLGTLYPGKQDLTPVWAALADLRRNGALSELRLRFIGDLPAVAYADLAAHGLADVTDATGFVTHGEALRWLNASSLLLFAGPARALAMDRGQIAAKVFEYLATGLPILYVGDGTLDVVAILRTQPGCHLLEADDGVGIRRVIMQARSEERSERKLERYTREQLTLQLAQLLDEVAL